ncbi:AzlD domain-containing protein [Kushneria aurantia]|uniref:AzlD domain-containing protein n=1 Tax=Kushneria aurantia TaxID=504092 RepID=A0ABV6G569_9GAMM|nr:AzlD domain-containing protein [Kushneria aurantia]
MSSALWLGVIAAALGTWLLRALPLLWMQRRLRRSPHRTGALPQWLAALGPMMIAAVLGVSLVPSEQSVTGWLATLAGSAITLALWWRLRSLGWPVVAGVAVFGVVVIILS